MKDAHIEALYEGAAREIAQARGEEQLGFQKELDDHLNREVADERSEWEELLEEYEPIDLDQMYDDYEDVLAEQESNYCRELLEMSN
jgi:hypothetical protein